MEDYYRAVDVTWRTKIWEIEALWQDKKKWNTLTDEQKREKILELHNIASQYSRDFANRFDHDRDLVKWDTNLAQRSGEAHRLAYWMNDELTKRIDKEFKQEIRNGARTLMAFSRSVNKGNNGPTLATRKSKPAITKSKPSRADRLATRNAKKHSTAFDSITEFNEERAAEHSLAFSNAPSIEQPAPNDSPLPKPSKSDLRDVEPACSYSHSISDSSERNEIASILLSLGSSRKSQAGPHSPQPSDPLLYANQYDLVTCSKRKRSANSPSDGEDDEATAAPRKTTKLRRLSSRIDKNQNSTTFADPKQANKAHNEPEVMIKPQNLAVDGISNSPSPATLARPGLPRQSNRKTKYKYEGDEDEDAKSDVHPKIKLRFRFVTVKQPAQKDKKITTASGLRSDTPGRKPTDVVCTSSDPEALQGSHYLLNQFGYPTYDKTAGRYLKTFVDANGVKHSNFDQAIHLTVRLEDKDTHEILEKTFPHPDDWNDPNSVKKAMKAAQQFCRRKAGAPGNKVRYSPEEVEWLKAYVASKTKVNWAAVVNRSSGPWMALWKAWQIKFPESKRGEEALWAKCGAGSDESRLGIINY